MANVATVWVLPHLRAVWLQNNRYTYCGKINFPNAIRRGNKHTGVLCTGVSFLILIKNCQVMICSNCHLEKSEIEFSKNKTYCKSCAKIWYNSWISRNREKKNEKTNEWHSKNKIHETEYGKMHLKETNIRVKKYRTTEKGIETNIKCSAFKQLKNQIGENPPPELVEVKVLIIKTKKLCKTSKNLETI